MPSFLQRPSFWKKKKRIILKRKRLRFRSAYQLTRILTLTICAAIALIASTLIRTGKIRALALLARPLRALINVSLTKFTGETSAVAIALEIV